MKKILRGVVTSDRRDKTVRVEIERRYRHRKYGKIVRSRLACHVHDPRNEASEGDLVEIIESQPLSKTKRWQLVRIIRAADNADIDAAGMTVSDEDVLETQAAEPPGVQVVEDISEVRTPDE